MKKEVCIKIDKFKDYSITLGNVSENSKAIYIDLSAWADPTIDKELDYKKIISYFNKTIKRKIYNYLSLYDNILKLFHKDRTIVDLDMKEAGIKFNKRSFVNTEITLFLTNEIKLDNLTLRPKLDNLIKEIISDCFNKNEYFKFYKTKKD